MVKLNENKTIKELIDKGFIFTKNGVMYPIKLGIFAVFSLRKDINYLKHIGYESLMLENPDKYKKKISKVLKELTESDFVIDEMDN